MTLRPRFKAGLMSDGTETERTMSEAESSAQSEGEGHGESEQKQQGKTFTEAEVTEIVKDRLKQQAKNQFGDYAELKTRAEGAKTLEDRFGDLEKQLSAANAKALRSDVAAKHGISAEDRDLFLTGSDEETLTAQATRLAAREADRKKNGNVAPKEGETKSTGGVTADLREFTKGLFGTAE